MRYRALFISAALLAAFLAVVLSVARSRQHLEAKLGATLARADALRSELDRVEKTTAIAAAGARLEATESEPGSTAVAKPPAPAPVHRRAPGLMDMARNN